MQKILALGNALVDVLIKTENDNLIKGYELPKGSMQLIDLYTAININNQTKQLKRKISSGGSAANTINGLAKLGIETGFIGKIGEDNFGEYFINGLLENKTTPVLFKSTTPTGRATTFISHDGERTFATYLGAAIEQAADELKSNYFKGYGYFHIEGYIVQNRELLERAFKLAKNNNLTTSIDLASYNVVEENIDFLKKIVDQYVDIVFANEEEAKAFTGKNPKYALHEISNYCDIAVVKLAEEGSLIKKGDTVIKVNSIKSNCIDTTGAGDLYASGFLYGLSKGFDLDNCGKIGSIVAGKVIENIGAGLTDAQWGIVKKEINNL